MTKISKRLLKVLLENEGNRRKGEFSSKKGKDYEDKATFFILTRFNKLLKLKSKINTITFNGVEDLDIFDDIGRLFSIQIKTRKNIWTKTDPDLVSFLENCITRINLVKNIGEQAEISFYFFTDITGNFLEKWNELHIEHPEKLYEETPVKIKNLLKKYKETERNLIFSKIQFFTGRKSTFLDPYIDETLFKKFKEFKNKCKPGELIEFAMLNSDIFHEKRLQKSRIYEPAYEQDLLISNILEVDIPDKTLYCAEKKDKFTLKDIQDYLKTKRIRISYLFKYNKIYCFHNFNKINPLKQYINESTVEKIYFDDLDDPDKVQMLNRWLYQYLYSIRLRAYHKYFYFFSQNKDKYIDWYDSKTRRIRSWRVVKETENFYENLGLDIRFQTFKNTYFLIINPRLFFSEDGFLLLNPKIMRDIEKSYRKSFMKNDFLRRRLYVLVSYIRGDVEVKKQESLLSYNKNTFKNQTRRKKSKFFDRDIIIFKDLIKLEVNFKPNIEAKSIAKEQKFLGEE